MNRRFVLAGAAALLLPARPAAAGQTQADADRMETAEAALAEYRGLAASHGKGVLILFHASWCSLCPYMARLMSNAAVTNVIGSRFDLLLMRALEQRPAQRALEFRGADALYNRFAPPNTGMPYLVFLDVAGATVATSATMGGNIGYPTEPFELDGFDTMLRTVAPDVTAAQLARARRACIELAPRT